MLFNTLTFTINGKNRARGSRCVTALLKLCPPQAEALSVDLCPSVGTHYVYWAPLKYTVTVQLMFR